MENQNNLGLDSTISQTGTIEKFLSDECLKCDERTQCLIIAKKCASRTTCRQCPDTDKQKCDNKEVCPEFRKEMGIQRRGGCCCSEDD